MSGVIRFIAWVSMLSAFAVLGAEAVAWLEQRRYIIRTGRDIWQSADISSYSRAQDNWPDWLWAITDALLSLPLAIALLIVAVLLFAASRSLQPRRVFY